MPETRGETVPNNSSNPRRKLVPSGRPVTSQERNIRPQGRDTTEAGRSSPKMRRRITSTIPGNKDLPPQTSVTLQELPPPLGQKGEVHLAEIPHPQPLSRFGLQNTDQDTHMIHLLRLTPL